MPPTNIEKGFTLTEILIVIAIISILSAVAVPNFLSWRPNMQLKAAARDLHSGLQNAKIEAIKRNADAVVSLTPVACPGFPNPTAIPSPGGGYQIFIDDGAGGGTAGNRLRDGGEQIVANVTMPLDVGFCSETFPGNTTGFSPKGLPLSIGTFTLNNINRRSYSITITISGGIRIQ